MLRSRIVDEPVFAELEFDDGVVDVVGLDLDVHLTFINFSFDDARVVLDRDVCRAHFGQVLDRSGPDDFDIGPHVRDVRRVGQHFGRDERTGACSTQYDATREERKGEEDEEVEFTHGAGLGVGFWVRGSSSDGR
ncbi:MAG: hypothetical protein ACI8TQ_002282 [Planctomycetota bacterium]